MGHWMGPGMMTVIAQVRDDLAALAHENNPAVIHQKLAQDQQALEQFSSGAAYPMQGRNGYGMGRYRMGPYAGQCPMGGPPQN